MDYALLHCFICGQTWQEHNPDCANHRHQAARMAEWRKIRPTLTAREINVLRANGWREEQEEVAAHG